MRPSLLQHAQLAHWATPCGCLVARDLTPCSHGLIDGALDLIIKRTGSSEGYLYLLKEGELCLATQKAEKAPSEQAIQAMQEAFTRFIEDSGATEMSATRTESNVGRSRAEDHPGIEPLVLAAKANGQRAPIGAAILSLKDRSAYRPDYAFFEAVAVCLYEAERTAYTVAV
jgi:hypothetical protein